MDNFIVHIKRYATINTEGWLVKARQYLIGRKLKDNFYTLPPLSTCKREGGDRETNMNEIFETDYQKSNWRKEEDRKDRESLKLFLAIIGLFILYIIGYNLLG